MRTTKGGVESLRQHFSTLHSGDRVAISFLPAAPSESMGTCGACGKNAAQQCQGAILQPGFQLELLCHLCLMEQSE